MSESPNDKDLGDETRYANKVVFLEERLDRHIKEYKKKRDRSRFKAALIKISTILLGATTTVILGIKEYPGWLSDHQSILSGIALIISAFVTVMTAWEAFSDYNWKWVRYRTTLTNLFNLRDDLRFIQAGGQPVPDDKTNEFYLRLKSALKETNEEWMSKRVKTISGQVNSGPIPTVEVGT